MVVLDDAGPVLLHAVARRVNEGNPDKAISVVLKAKINKCPDIHRGLSYQFPDILRNPLKPKVNY